MNLPSRIASLRDRHATLEARITDEDLRPRPNDAVLGALKRRKLQLKQELERLKSRPDEPRA